MNIVAQKTLTTLMIWLYYAVPCLSYVQTDSFSVLELKKLVILKTHQYIYSQMFRVFTPQPLRVGIVFIHGVQIGGQVGG